MEPKHSADAGEGVRDRKRRETLQRISEAGMRLFLQQGYDGTTLDAIAAEAGISRRTFFHYFKSKDEILLSMQSGLGAPLVAKLAERDPAAGPAAALRAAMLATVADYPRDELIVIDRVMLSSEAVQSRKQASYLRDEGVVFEALRQFWPGENPVALRYLAMLAIGTARLSLEAWRNEGSTRSLGEVLQDMLAAVDALGDVNPR